MADPKVHAGPRPQAQKVGTTVQINPVRGLLLKLSLPTYACGTDYVDDNYHKGSPLIKN